MSEITKDDVFQGQGRGEDIPRYLRVEGPVKHRHLNQSEANLMINGFWHHRLTSTMETEQMVREEGGEEEREREGERERRRR